MRILILNHNLVERGAYFRARETARLHHEAGHDVTFICTGPQFYRPRERRVPRWREIHTASWSPAKDPGEGLGPLGLLQRLGPAMGGVALVHTFSHKPVDQFPARLARALGAFWVADWCDLWDGTRGGLLDMSQWTSLPREAQGWRGPLFRAINRWENCLERSLVRDADAITIISSWMRTQTRRLGRADGDVHLYPSGADTRRIRPLPKAAARARLGIEPRGPVIGYVANVTPDNAQLEGAFARVLDHMPQAMMLVAGPQLEGPRFAEAARRGALRQLGRIPFREVRWVLGAADVLVIPMRDTPYNRSRWPHKFGDYMAAGRPVATTAVGDVPRTIQRHGIGAVGAPDEEGLARAILEVLEAPRAWAEMGRRARAAAEGPESWTAHHGRLRAWLREFGVAV